MSKERLTIDEIIEHCKRKTELYDNKGVACHLESCELEFSYVKEYWEHRQVAGYLEELKQYRDLEEQGLLLRLPCKVGDTIWELCRCDDVYRIFPMVVKCVEQYGSIRLVKGKEPTVWNIYAESDYTYMYKSFYDIGKTVFLTKSEAEEKLREIKESEE